MTFFLDRKLFKGNAALVTDGAAATEMLASVNANFTVDRVPAEYNGRQYPAHQLWIAKTMATALVASARSANRSSPRRSSSPLWASALSLRTVSYTHLTLPTNREV